MAVTTLAEARRRLESVSRARRREREERQEMGARLTRTGSGAVAAPLFGFLTTQFPRMASFDSAGRFPTAPIVGGAMVVASLFADDAGDVLEGAGAGVLLPWLSDFGGRVAGKI